MNCYINYHYSVCHSAQYLSISEQCLPFKVQKITISIKEFESINSSKFGERGVL